MTNLKGLLIKKYEFNKENKKYYRSGIVGVNNRARLWARFIGPASSS